MARGVAVVALMMLAGAGLPDPTVADQPAASRVAERACFEETGSRHCVDLFDGCAADAHACLIDDLTGALLRSDGDASQRYAAYLARGMAARRALRSSNAIADFQAAQSLQPHLAAPFVLMGRLLADLGRHGEAAASFDEANRRAPGLPAILLLRAGVRLELGVVSGAIADLDEAIAVTGARTPLPAGAGEALETLLGARATAWLAAGDRAKARIDAEAALALAPDQREARAVLARLAAER